VTPAPASPPVQGGPQPAPPPRSEVNGPVVGIDLGTTYSVVAYLDAHGRPVSIPTPSATSSRPASSCSTKAARSSARKQ